MKFGTDGVRGKAGEPPLDPVTVRRLGAALVRSFFDAHEREHHDRHQIQVVCGRDTRESGTWIEAELAHGAGGEGAEVTSVGVVPTPAVAYLTRAFEHYESPLVSIDVLLGWSTSRFTSVTVPHQERQVGRSNYTFRSLVRHTLNMVTGFSILPLQLATVIGCLSMLFGLAVLAFVLIRYLREGSATAPGFPFLASIIVIFAGAQLFALGIIGEYLGRMHLRSMARPTYAVRRRVVQGHEP